MSTQPTPDELTVENELICERLLGWSKAQWFGGWAGNWDRPDGGMCAGTPTFMSWAEAGLILDVLQKLSYDSIWAADALVMLSDRLIGALLTPADIRKEALTCIGRLK